jgi:hypothetical protein
MIFNIRKEVEAILGRTLDDKEFKAYIELRDVGYANPYDIVAALKNMGF